MSATPPGVPAAPARGAGNDPAATTTALRLAGRDALPLLHRVTSNALADLPPGRLRPTLFCDFRGRLLHRALVGHAADGAVWLLRDDAPGDELAAFVDRMIFRDDVRIEDRSSEHAPGAEVDGLPWPARLAERERVALGAPRHAHEIRDEFNPYEVNLAGEVHLNKGCYTGQEALQRMVTYGGVRRQLALVTGEGPVPATPQELKAPGGVGGRLTSAVAAEAGWTGLAVLRRDAEGPFALATGGALARVTPFPAARPLGVR